MDWIFDLMGFRTKNGLLTDNGYMVYFTVSKKIEADQISGKQFGY